MKKSPPISVIVVTYNSSKYVLDTLESIKEQDYEGPIELIISDDCSTDDTVKICKQWLCHNSKIFQSYNIIQTPYNLGICGNYNFALKYVTGEWIKYIAGDDLLMPNALSTYISKAEESGDKAFCSGVFSFNEEPELDVISATYGEHYVMGEWLDSKDPADQYKNLIFPPEDRRGLVDGPTLFIHTDSLRDLGGMDMRYPMLEDLPFAINWTKSGRHLGIIKLPLVKYREYTESVSQKYASSYFNTMAWNVFLDARIDYYLTRRDIIRAWDTRVKKAIVNHQGKGLKNSIIRKLWIISNPMLYICIINRIKSKYTFKKI